MHYDGGLRWSDARGSRERARGWAACVFGAQALEILRGGRQTIVVSKVTCLRCKSLIEQARRANATEGSHAV